MDSSRMQFTRCTHSVTFEDSNLKRSSTMNVWKLLAPAQARLLSPQCSMINPWLDHLVWILNLQNYFRAVDQHNAHVARTEVLNDKKNWAGRTQLSRNIWRCRGRIYLMLRLATRNMMLMWLTGFATVVRGGGGPKKYDWRHLCNSKHLVQAVGAPSINLWIKIYHSPTVVSFQFTAASLRADRKSEDGLSANRKWEEETHIPGAVWKYNRRWWWMTTYGLAIERFSEVVEVGNHSQAISADTCHKRSWLTKKGSPVDSESRRRKQNSERIRPQEVIDLLITMFVCQQKKKICAVLCRLNIELITRKRCVLNLIPKL